MQNYSFILGYDCNITDNSEGLIMFNFTFVVRRFEGGVAKTVLHFVHI